MYEPFRDNQKNLTLKITWDTNTAKGFMVSLILTFIMMLLLAVVEPPDFSTPAIKKPTVIPRDTMMAIALYFGPGTGPGGSKGNLTREGKAHKGQPVRDQLEDAKIKAPGGRKSRSLEDNPQIAQNMNPVDAVSSGEDEGGKAGTGSRDVGTKDGTPDGTGLGDQGSGRGAGLGLGKISWGQGGNRIVSYKPPRPSYPNNVDIREAVITVRFHVDPNGSVIRAVPMKKVDPTLERVAVDYVKRYRFNPLDTNLIMVGTINIVFRKG